MKQIKLFHEAPKSIFNKVQAYTDGDYALVHLFETDPEYFFLFKEAVESGREVILDNSIFELGTAFDPEKFLYWINELNPTYYIVPDVLEDATGTIGNMEDWIKNYKNRVTGRSKMIGVVQGSSYSDLVRCYQYMDKVAEVDKIAISFDYSYYEASVPHPNKLMSWMLGRVKLVSDLLRNGILNTEKPHHMLGCALPGEGIFYPSEYFEFIDSMDTSNPILHSLLNIGYKGPLGLTFKQSQKLCTLINSEVSPEEWKIAEYNMREFRKLWQGTYGI